MWTKLALDVWWYFFVVPGLGYKYNCNYNPKWLIHNDNKSESKIHVSQENEKMVANIGWGKPSKTKIQTAIFPRSGNLLSLSSTSKDMMISSFYPY